MEKGLKEAYPSMEEASEKIGFVEIEKASNGYVVTYTQKESKPKGSMEHAEYIRNKKLFSLEEEDKAFEYYVKYLKVKLNQKEEGYY